jgi:hypothetical protein
MSAGVTLQGFDELRQALGAMPATLAAEASDVIDRHAQAAARDIAHAYPVWNGPPSYIRGRLVTPEHLRDSVEVVPGSSAFKARYLVRSTSPLVYIFENGTEERENGNFAGRGAMPAGEVFIPRAIAHREAMTRELMAMVARHGFLVRAA